MNKIFLTVLSLVVVLLASCIGEEKDELLKQVDLRLEFSEYTSLPRDSEPYNNQYFTPNHSAKDYLPDWLINKYFSVKDGSIATVSYLFKDYDKPAELTSLYTKRKLTLTDDNYIAAWGSVQAKFYSPKVSPDVYIPAILNGLGRSEEGDYHIVAYNYTPVEPTILENQEVIHFVEAFDDPSMTDWGVVKTDRWFNQIVEGSGRQWSTMLGKTNSTPNMFSYNRTAGADSWLITNNAIDMTKGQNYEISFDFGWGYSLEDRMFNFEVLYTDFFDGIDPRNSMWIDITNQFLFHVRDDIFINLNNTAYFNPSTGYPGLRNYKTNNSALFDGEKIFLAFRDKLLPIKTDGTYSTSPLYFVDNIKVTAKVDIADSDMVEEKYSVFKYTTDKWVMDNEIYILQPADYTEINMPFLSLANSHLFIPDLLQKRLPAKEGDRKNIIYFTENMQSIAEDYIYENDIWKPNSPLITNKTDRYVFNADKFKWILDSSVN